MAVKNTIGERNFKILVSKLHKKSAVYKSEGIFLKLQKQKRGMIMKKTNERIERVMTERMLLHLVNLKLITKDEHEILLEKACGGINKPVYENSA